jgi:hypothetical protein
VVGGGEGRGGIERGDIFLLYKVIIYYKRNLLPTLLKFFQKNDVLYIYVRVCVCVCV